MFTGIITDIGTILSRDTSGGDLVIRVGTNYDSTGIKLGESMACNGCCLTVIDKGVQETPPAPGGRGGKRNDRSIARSSPLRGASERRAPASGGTLYFFDVQLSQETLNCTAGDWNVGDTLNLERALKIGDDLSGHFVTGHVDGVAKITGIEPSGDSHAVTFQIPDGLEKFIAAKGSVTLNGVSLTVSQVEGNQFTINLIPHSWDNTNFAQLTVGDGVNLEVDILARYVVNAMSLQHLPDG